MSARRLLHGGEKVFCWAALALALVAPRCEAEDEAIVRRAGESLATFAARLIPSGMDLAYPPVEVRCGPAGANIVVLFRPKDGGSNYTGWVLGATADAGNYRKYPLPPMDEIDNQFDIDVKNVFAARVSGVEARVLVILYHYYRLGTGDQEGTASYVYRWDGSAFQIDAEAGRRVHKLKSEKAIRARLGAAAK